MSNYAHGSAKTCIKFPSVMQTGNLDSMLELGIPTLLILRNPIEIVDSLMKSPPGWSHLEQDSIELFNFCVERVQQVLAKSIDLARHGAVVVDYEEFKDRPSRVLSKLQMFSEFEVKTAENLSIERHSKTGNLYTPFDNNQLHPLIMEHLGLLETRLLIHYERLRSF